MTQIIAVGKSPDDKSCAAARLPPLKAVCIQCMLYSGSRVRGRGAFQDGIAALADRRQPGVMADEPEIRVAERSQIIDPALHPRR